MAAGQYTVDANDIGAGLDLAQLGIIAAKKCWLLHIDALIIGADGSLADAASLAVKVRLMNMLHPLCNPGRPAVIALYTVSMHADSLPVGSGCQHV